MLQMSVCGSHSALLWTELYMGCKWSYKWRDDMCVALKCSLCVTSFYYFPLILGILHYKRSSSELKLLHSQSSTSAYSLAVYWVHNTHYFLTSFSGSEVQKWTQFSMPESCNMLHFKVTTIHVTQNSFCSVNPVYTDNMLLERNVKALFVDNNTLVARLNSQSERLFYGHIKYCGRLSVQV